MRFVICLLCVLLAAGRAVGADILRYTGVNLSGAEFGGTTGAYGYAYIYPTASGPYFRAKNMDTFRLPFRWERLQPTLGEAFDAAEWQRLQDCVTALTASGAAVLLDPHNYARYKGKLIGASDGPSDEQFADLWRRLATRWKNDPRVLFGLMNEPNGVSGEQWAASANHAIVAIRALGANNLILVPGVAWTGAASWYATWYGTPNATSMLTITDPADNFAFEVHMYVDSDSSGTHFMVANDDPLIGAKRLAQFTAWCREHGKRGFLGEFATPASALGLTTAENTLAFIDDNRDVWLGWTWWSAGPWWGTYGFSVQPTAIGGDQPQMPILERHLVDVVIDPTTNSPPAVSAGVDITFRLPAHGGVTGTVHDDGLPTASVTTTWTKVSGPGTVTFGDAHALVTTVTASVAGTYVLRLTASDGVLSTSDTVTVTVGPVLAIAATTITFTGTVKAGTTALKVDGTPVVISGSNGFFSVTLPVGSSTTVHTLSTTDAQGHTSTRTLTLAPTTGGAG